MQKRISNLLFSIGIVAFVVGIAFLLLLIRTTIEAHAENSESVVTETELDSAQNDDTSVMDSETVIIEDEEVALAAYPEDQIANLYWIWFVIAVLATGIGAFFGIGMKRKKEDQNI